LSNVELDGVSDLLSLNRPVQRDPFLPPPPSLLCNLFPRDSFFGPCRLPFSPLFPRPPTLWDGLREWENSFCRGKRRSCVSLPVFLLIRHSFVVQNLGKIVKHFRFLSRGFPPKFSHLQNLYALRSLNCQFFPPSPLFVPSGYGVATFLQNPYFPV